MSPIRTSPLPKTIALGGVATGSMKAQEADTVAGTINRYGETPSTCANAAITGISAPRNEVMVKSLRFRSAKDWFTSANRSISRPSWAMACTGLLGTRSINTWDSGGASLP